MKYLFSFSDSGKQSLGFGTASGIEAADSTWGPCEPQDSEGTMSNLVVDEGGHAAAIFHD